MKAIAIAIIAAASALGCSSQEVAQQRLMNEMNRGLNVLEQSASERQKLLENLFTSRRKQLDAAFDADVQQVRSLDAKWVIEHRKAYSAALEMMWQQELASKEAHLRGGENVQAIREGLDRLTWMSELRRNWTQTLSTQETNHEQR